MDLFEVLEILVYAVLDAFMNPEEFGNLLRSAPQGTLETLRKNSGVGSIKSRSNANQSAEN